MARCRPHHAWHKDHEKRGGENTPQKGPFSPPVMTAARTVSKASKRARAVARSPIMACEKAFRFWGRSRRTRATPVVSLTVTLMCWAPSMLLFSNYSALERVVPGLKFHFANVPRERPKLWHKPGRPRRKPNPRVTLPCANETYTRYSMQEVNGRSRRGDQGSIQGRKANCRSTATGSGAGQRNRLPRRRAN